MYASQHQFDRMETRNREKKTKKVLKHLWKRHSLPQENVAPERNRNILIRAGGSSKTVHLHSFAAPGQVASGLPAIVEIKFSNSSGLTGLELFRSKTSPHRCTAALLACVAAGKCQNFVTRSGEVRARGGFPYTPERPAVPLGKAFGGSLPPARAEPT